MVTQNSDSKLQKPVSPMIGSTVSVCAILAWLTILIGCASIFWNDQTATRGGEWADRAANGSAICVALVYFLSGVLTLWFLTKLVFGKLTFQLMQFYLVSLVPLVLVVWGILEARYSSKWDNQHNVGIIQRVIQLDKLAHHRLFGGSLWQPSVDGRTVRLIGSESTETSKKIVEQLDEFVDQVHQVAFGESSADTIRLHTKPFLSSMVLSTANWVNFPVQSNPSDALSNDQWRATAVAAIDASSTAAVQPPSFFRLGFIDYFSCNTDDLMDAYFDARSKSGFFPSLGEFLNETNYAATSKNHGNVGAVFATYLLEDQKLNNLSTLWNTSDSETFKSRLEELVGKKFEQIESGFETWLRSEADRLGWDRHKVFHTNVAVSPNDQDVAMQLNQRLDSIELADGVLEEYWKTLREACKDAHRRRLAKMAISPWRFRLHKKSANRLLIK